MSNPLVILETAISDVGYWQWLSESLPNRFQLEFGGTQLWSPALKDSQPPSNLVALSFVSPMSVNFLTRKSADIPTDWPQLLQQDQLEPLQISYDAFTLSNPEQIIEMLKEAGVIETSYGCDPRSLVAVAAR